MIQFELDVVRPLTSQVNPTSNHWLWDPLVYLIRNTGVGLGLTQLNRLVDTIVRNLEPLGPEWGTEPAEIFPPVPEFTPQIKIIGKNSKNRGIFERTTILHMDSPKIV